MSSSSLTLCEMVITVLKANAQKAMKPAEIASTIQEKYPAYCTQKIQETTQTNFNVVQQIAAQVSAGSKSWMLKVPQLKSSEETPRTYWWEQTDASEVAQAPCTIQVPAASNPDVLVEKSLYPKLAAYLIGMKSRAVYPKRIEEGTSSNTNGKNGNSLLHPDLVALEDLMPQPEWSSDMKEWATNSGARQSKLWSFEVKINVTSISDARESYFQALANSAWANFGYLVATKFSDKAFHELKILHDLHGIGVIQLDVANPDDDTIVKLPARERENVDWGTCNRIASQNGDFRKFIEQVSHFHLTRKIRQTDWVGHAQTISPN